ncbi:MAG: pilus assembly protein TadG-related protein [Acidimicrobiia bacterium]
MTPIRRIDPGEERGVILVVTALIVVALAVVVALVVDLGQLRTDRRTNKSVADVAARAGISRLPFGPWAGVCQARRYLLDNARGFSAFDAGSETWSNAASPPTVHASSPCPANPLTPDATPCQPNAPGTWARLQATAGGGRFTVEIQAGYAMPDSRFGEDTALADTGDPAAGSCDNLAVIVTQRRPLLFAPVVGIADGETRVRSVGRLNAVETLEFVAALQLLEEHKCAVLETGGANTRVISQPFGTYPGTIQIDSAADSGSCPSPILNGQATSGGPSIVACSADSTNPSCSGGTGTRASRIGIYALNFTRPAGYVTSAYPSTYGDTRAIASPRTGRKYADRRYRENIRALDATVKSTITGNSGRPPGCAAVVDSSCTGNGVTWLVLQPADCNSLATFFLLPGRTSAPNIWFNCDLNVNTPLTLTASDASIVVTGQLQVGSTFTVTDARRLYVGGRSTGNKVGLDVGTGGTFTVNAGSHLTCKTRNEVGHTTRLVVGSGSMKVASGSTMRLCQTVVLLASGYDKVPTADGSSPCQTSACVNYTGSISISSGGFVDWSAPNEIRDRLPTAAELATTNPFEDLALWTEAGGNANSMAGGATTSMAGSFFMPNADAFNLTGGGALPVYLSAQFIATSMKVSGGATVNLVPNPLDSIPTSVYTVLLVR